MKLHIKENIAGFIIALLLVAGTSISFNLSLSKEVLASAPECVCAERINWLGACRGDTTRLCKGDDTCTQCGVLSQE